jgi:hypothetical protein
VSAPDPDRPAPDPKRVALERRYRRLLRCYPPGHRAAHQDEMLGVLLDTARPGQRAPGLRQTVNLAGWLAVVLLALAGRRRTAAVIASALLALALVNPLTEVVHQASGGYVYVAVPLFLSAASVSPVVLASLAACSLAFSAGPRPGLAIAGRRRACLMIAGLSVVFGYPAVAYLVSPSASWDGFGLITMEALTIAVAAVVTRVPGTVGWRIAVLVAGPMLVLDAASIYFGGSTASVLVPLLGIVLFAVLMWPVAIASWRGRSSRTAAG